MSDPELCCGERLHSAQILCPTTSCRWLPLDPIGGTVPLPKHPDHIPMLEVRVRCAHVRGGACALARACVRTCAWAWLRALAQERMKIFACGVHVRALPLVRLGPATAHASVMPWHAQINRARTRALAGALTQSNTRTPTARHMHAHTHIHTRTFARVPLACKRLVVCSHAPLGTVRRDRHPLPRPRPGRHRARRTT